VLLFSLLALGGVIVGLITPRRRVWVKATASGFEVAALSKREDPRLEEVVRELTEEIKKGSK
jgi:cytochrome c biogenesis protein